MYFLPVLGQDIFGSWKIDVGHEGGKKKKVTVQSGILRRKGALDECFALIPSKAGANFVIMARMTDEDRKRWFSSRSHGGDGMPGG